jgi:hypothetical protein
MEPIRQQLDGQETDMVKDDSIASEQRRLTAPPEPGSGPKLGFGQFIKSVTSPTNVRVTAGGRIVANTRGTSPTGKMYREKGPGDALVLSRSGSQSGQMVAAVPHGAYMQPQAMYSPYAAFPGAMGFYPPAMQMPMAPMSVGPGTFPSQQGSYFAAPSTNKATGEDDSKAKDQKPTAAPQQTPNGPNYHGPFFPPMMAMPMQMPMQMPVAMMHPQVPFQNHSASVFGYGPGLHAASYGQTTGSVPVSASQFGHFHAVPGMSSAAPSHISSQYPPTHAANAQPMNVPSSSIKLSDVIKKHLEGFREHLKWTTDQVEYNTHQIDEKDMNARILQIREQIATHERRLQEQLEAEQKLSGGDKIARGGRRPDSGSGGAADKFSKPDTTPVANSATHDAKQDRGKTSSITYQEDSNDAVYATYKKDRSRSKVWNMKQRSMHLMGSTDNGESSDTSTAPLHQMSHNIKSEPAKKASGLPMTAALAAPFEPRGHQDHPSQEELGPDPAEKAQTLPWPAAKYASKASKEAAASAPSELGTPYLRGKLRFGVDPLKARDDDYSYPRKLTEEEKKARGYYWGKAPRTVTYGLPRFDGKDFYPPSPVKEVKLISPVKENQGLPLTEPASFGKKPAMPTGSYSDYIPKVASSLDKSSSDIKRTAAGKPTNPYLAIIEGVFQKDEMEAKKAREKRATQSDNINGSAADSNKSLGRNRPTASLISEDPSDSDLAKSTGSAAPITESPGSGEVLLFKGRRHGQRTG